jgi:hypothetical protein
VLAGETGPKWARGLEPLEWDKVADAVYMPMWRSRVDRHGHVLRAYTIATLPTTTAELVKLGSSLFDGEQDEITDRDRVGRAWQLITAAIALRLTSLGWTVEVLPGDEVVLRRDGHELRPFSELQAVMDGRGPSSRWRDRCAALGIAELPLWGAAARA